jgi:hypothetical protein
LRERHFRIKLTGPADPADLQLDVVSRTWGGKGQRLLTLTLVNCNTLTKPVNENCFFQCEMTITPAEGSCVAPHPERPGGSLDDEESSLALLYRHRPTYAVGHGCAADWDAEDGLVISIRTGVLPVYKQASIEARGSIDGVILSMKSLAEMQRPDIIAACHALADSYEQWIEDRGIEAAKDASLNADMRATADRHIEGCRKCLERIRDGIALLTDDDDVLHAFRLANRAMLEQRDHYALSSDANQRRGWILDQSNEPMPESAYAAPPYPPTTEWRPFQLALVLMNLRNMRDPLSDARKIVDVIWFPTGGGKTEAYLGLAAYAIILRRLLDTANAGTTVLMRYTLRLLTTQRFQRAASLICALERMRRSAAGKLGNEPISIGLWLGAGVTPNKHAESVSHFNGLKTGDRENRFVVLSCPWCGVDMGLKDFGGGRRPILGYRLIGSGDGRRVQFRCEDPGCDFSDEAGLPIHVVDQGSSIPRRPC